MSDQNLALQQLIRLAVEQSTEAARSAQNIVFSEIIKLLIDKGAIATPDLHALFDRLDQVTATTAQATPVLSSALGDTSMLLRQAFPSHTTTLQ